MSEVVTITGGYTGTIYGTFANALAHMQTHFGSAYTTFIGISTDDQKRALISAADYIGRFAWTADADTFAERDAITAFVTASYELGAMVSEDETALGDQSATAQSVSDGGVSVTFRDNKTKRGAASVLPPLVALLIGKYLVTGVGKDATLANQSSDATNPFADADDFDRKGPF